MADISDPKIDEGLSYLQAVKLWSVMPTNSPFIAYLDVRSDKSETKWMLLDYESDRSDTLRVTQTGTGSLDELSEILDDSRASYAYARVSFSNDKESIREKFILVVIILPISVSALPNGNSLVLDRKELQGHEESKGVLRLDTRPLRLLREHSHRDPRYQISVHLADVKHVLRVFSIEVPAREKEDLKEDPIVVRLRKVCKGLPIILRTYLT